MAALQTATAFSSRLSTSIRSNRSRTHDTRVAKRRVVEDPVHVVDRLPNELRCDPEWPLRLVKLGDSRLGRFKLGRNRLDLDVDPLGSSRAGTAKSTAQVGVFLLELANPRLRLIEIGRTPLGAHLDVLVEQMDHVPDSRRGHQSPRGSGP